MHAVTSRPTAVGNSLNSQIQEVHSTHANGGREVPEQERQTHRDTETQTQSTPLSRLIA